VVHSHFRGDLGDYRICQDLDRLGHFQILGGDGSHHWHQVWAIDASGRVGGNRHCAGLPFQQTPNSSNRVGGLDEYQLCRISPRVVGDELEKPVWLSRQPHGRPPHLATSCRQHHESVADLPASWQLRPADLAVEKENFAYVNGLIQRKEAPFYIKLNKRKPMNQLPRNRTNGVNLHSWTIAAFLYILWITVSLNVYGESPKQLNYQHSLELLSTNRPLVITFSADGVQGTVSNLQAISSFPNFEMPSRPTLYRAVFTDTGFYAYRVTTFSETSRILSGTNSVAARGDLPSVETIVGIHGNVLWSYHENHLVTMIRSNTFGVMEQLLQALTHQPQDPVAIRLLSVMVDLNSFLTLGFYGLEPGSMRITESNVTANQTNGKEITGQVRRFNGLATEENEFQGIILNFRQNNEDIQQALVLHSGNLTNSSSPRFFPHQMVMLRKMDQFWVFERLITVWSLQIHATNKTITSDPAILFGSRAELFTMSNGMPYRLIGSKAVKAPGILNTADAARPSGVFSLEKRRFVRIFFVTVIFGMSIVALVWLLASRKVKNIPL